MGHIGLQPLDVLLLRRASVENADVEIEVLAEALVFPADLESELAGMAEDDDPNLICVS